MYYIVIFDICQQIHVTSFLVGSVLNASVETLLMGLLTVFATLALLEIPSPSALVRSTLFDSNSTNSAAYYHGYSTNTFNLLLLLLLLLLLSSSSPSSSSLLLFS